MLKAEAAEKQRTIIEIAQRLDMHDEAIADRVASDEFQSLLRKGFRDWPGAESEEKRVLMRNILSNAGATRVVSDDVVKLFMEWVKLRVSLSSCRKNIQPCRDHEVRGLGRSWPGTSARKLCGCGFV